MGGPRAHGPRANGPGPRPDGRGVWFFRALLALAAGCGLWAAVAERDWAKGAAAAAVLAVCAWWAAAARRAVARASRRDRRPP